MNKKQIHKLALSRVKNYKRSESELIEVLQWVDSQKVYFDHGCSSTSDYCVRVLNLSYDIAMTFINVMRKSKEVPELLTAIKSETLLLSNARRIAPLLNQENQKFWITQASASSNRELEKVIKTHFPEMQKRETLRTVSETRVSLTIEITHQELEILERSQDLQSKSARESISMAKAIVGSAKTYIEKHDPIEKAKRTKRLVTLPAKNSKTIPTSSRHAVHKRDQGQCMHIYSDGKRCTHRRFTE